ncbi:ABC transporter ATP-binding protein [Sutterella wadsworthensis]
MVYRGSIVEYGPAEAVMNSPKHPYTQQLIQANRMASTRA